MLLFIYPKCSSLQIWICTILSWNLIGYVLIGYLSLVTKWKVSVLIDLFHFCQKCSKALIYLAWLLMIQVVGAMFSKVPFISNAIMKATGCSMYFNTCTFIWTLQCFVLFYGIDLKNSIENPAGRYWLSLFKLTNKMLLKKVILTKTEITYVWI